MLIEVPGRMLAPMLVLEAAGTLRSKLQLRLLTIAAQREMGGRQEAYAFEAGRYGPRCGLLDRDVSSSPHLVEHSVSQPSISTSRLVHRYSIAGPGEARLAGLKAGAGQGLVGAAEAAIRSRLQDMPVALLEEAYGAPDPGGDAGCLERRVRADLEGALGMADRAYEETSGLHAASVAEVLETVGTVLSGQGKGPGGVQRMVALRLAGEAAEECRALCGLAPEDITLIDPRLADADDLASNLVRYCRAKGTMGDDPMEKPLTDLISVEEARQICATTWDA